MDWNDSVTPWFSSMGLNSVLCPHHPSRAITEGPLCHPDTKSLIEQPQVLRGFNVGFRANRQPAVLALAIQGLCKASRTVGKPIDLVSLDVRRPSDSGSLATLQRSLGRIQGYIRMLTNIHTSRSAHILTPRSFTQPPTPASGLGRGRKSTLPPCGSLWTIPCCAFWEGAANESDWETGHRTDAEDHGASSETRMKRSPRNT